MPARSRCRQKRLRRSLILRTRQEQPEQRAMLVVGATSATIPSSSTDTAFTLVCFTPRIIASRVVSRTDEALLLGWQPQDAIVRARCARPLRLAAPAPPAPETPPEGPPAPSTAPSPGRRAQRRARERAEPPAAAGSFAYPSGESRAGTAQRPRRGRRARDLARSEHVGTLCVSMGHVCAPGQPSRRIGMWPVRRFAAFPVGSLRFGPLYAPTKRVGVPILS